MTGIGILGNGVFCVVLVGILNVSIAVAAYGTYGPIMNQRVGIRTEKRPVEEALLNFSIEEVSGGGLRSACASDRSADRDQRLLDPQLPASDKRKHWDPANFMNCTENESIVPMN